MYGSGAFAVLLEKSTRFTTTAALRMPLAMCYKFSTRNAVGAHFGRVTMRKC